MFMMNRPKGPDKPNDLARCLRELAAAVTGMTPYPAWFLEDNNRPGPNPAWRNILTKAADELEQMQKLNGKLYKTLYPD